MNCSACGKPLRGHTTSPSSECECPMVVPAKAEDKATTDRIFGYFILTVVSIILLVMLAVQSADNNRLKERVKISDSCYRRNMILLDSVVRVNSNRDSIFMENFYRAAEAWEKKGKHRQMPPAQMDTTKN